MGSSGSRGAPQDGNVVDGVVVVGTVVVVDPPPLATPEGALAEGPPDPQAAARTPTRATPRRRATTLADRGECALTGLPGRLGLSGQRRGLGEDVHA